MPFKVENRNSNVKRTTETELYGNEKLKLKTKYKIIERVFSFNVSYSTLKNARVEDE